MERYEIQNSSIETQPDDEQSALIAKTMVSVVAAMALIVMATVLVFASGGSVLA